MHITKITEPRFPTQRFKWDNWSEGGWNYKLLEEMSIDGLNIACIHGKYEDGNSKYAILVDISRYQEGMQQVYRVFRDFNTIPYPKVVFKLFHLKEVKFEASITYPGHWDNGFGNQCFLAADILSFARLRNEMKYELKTGIIIKDELHRRFDSIVDEIVPEVTKFTDFLSSVAPVEYPPIEIRNNW